MPARVPSSKLERAFISASAAVGEVHTIGEAGLAQQLCQTGLRRRMIQVADVPQLAGLLDQRPLQIGIVVSQRVDGNAGHAIDILAPLRVRHTAPLAMIQHKVGAGVDLEEVGVFEVDSIHGEIVSEWQVQIVSSVRCQVSAVQVSGESVRMPRDHHISAWTALT